MGYQSLWLAPHAPLHLAQQTAALGNLTQQFGGTPTRAIALMPGRDLVVDLTGADRIGPIHQAAAIAGKTEAVEPHDVDIARPDGLALLQDLARLVEGGEQQSPQDLLVGKCAPLDRRWACDRPARSGTSLCQSFAQGAPARQGGR